MTVLLSAGLSVVAAAGNAVASVLQRKAARRQPDAEAFELKLVWHLVQQPAWVGGVGALVVAFVLQAAALATGPIALVQPILIVELAFTLLLTGAVFHRRPRAREWVAVLGMSVGIALLLVALRPTGGDPTAATGLTWGIACGATVAVIAGFVVAGRRKQDAGRAANLGVAAGVTFGFTAALLSAVTTAVSRQGAGALFTTWQTYVLIVIGPAGFFLLQNALQGGLLVASQPALTLANPLTAVGWGIAVFSEQVRWGAWTVAEVAGVVLIAGCTVLLARSPSLSDQSSHSQDDRGYPTNMTDHRPLALVTGASSGIGRELAREFAEHGYDLIVTAEDSGIEAAAAQLRVDSTEVRAVRADLRTEQGVEQVWAAVTATGRNLDAAALNAGVGAGGGFLETNLADEFAIIDLNIRSTVHLAKLVLRDMAARNEGSVLITSSIASTMPGSFQAVYNASKSFLQSFAQAVASELRDTGITITSLMPGPTETNFFHRAGMDDTKVGQSEKDDPAQVARQGFAALMKGKDKIVAGSMKTKAQAAADTVLPDKAKAAMHRQMAEPGSGDE